MGLFSKSKENEDLMQIDEIKQVSTELPTSPSLPELNEPIQSAPVNEFNNPFAQNNNSVSNEMPSLDLNNQTQAATPIPAMPEQAMPQLDLNQPAQVPTQQPQATPPIADLMPQAEPPVIQEQPQANSIFQTNQTPTTQDPLASQLPSDQTIQTQTAPVKEVQTQPNSLETIVQKQEYTKDQIQELVDETVEQVIEERWEQIVQKIEKVAQWKDKQEQHINLIKEDIMTMKESFEKLEKRIIDKVSSYDRNILDVNSELKALEKVFQKITPTLVNNVNELSAIAKSFKKDANTEKIE